MTFLKDHPTLSVINLPESAPPAAQSAIARQWQSLAPVMSATAKHLGVEPAAALAVWMVEAGDLPFEPGRPILRFECHKFWDHWGQHHPERFDMHFRFGGHAGVTGTPWTNHAIRPTTTSDWQSFHGKQANEYMAFDLATQLGGLEAACLSSSFGGPQILGSNHARIGYASAEQLYRAFAKSLATQVLGFFDFCQGSNIIRVLMEKHWHGFAQVYNGPGQAAAYASLINDAYLEATHCLHGTPLHPSLVEKQAFDMPAFATAIAPLGLKHFTARELLYRGRQHAEVGHSAYGLNGYPARHLWPNLFAVAKLLDQFRVIAAKPMVLTSIYRSPAYNRAITGSANSLHQDFAAIDFEVRSPEPASHWANLLRKHRNTGAFAGAVGLHGNAIHVDARGTNIDF